jgi:hypothetical protein
MSKDGLGMKLLSRNHDGCTFLIGKKARRILLELLQRYPVTTDSYQGERSTALNILPDGEEQLLAEALTQARQQIRLELKNILRNEDSWAEDPRGVRLLLTPDQLEIMLQILNDVRVGSWMRLGCPADIELMTGVQLSEATIELTWAINMATWFQVGFLKAQQPG